MQIALAKRNFPGETHCGDQIGYWRNGTKTTLCMVDGLGHGKGAEEAAKMAVNYVAAHVSKSLPDIFSGCDKAIRNTRGAAMSIAILDQEAGTLTCAGIGNTRVLIAGTSDSRPAAFPGIVGGGFKKLIPETVPFRPGDLVILFTDGISERMNLSAYDASLLANPQELAERILAALGGGTTD